MSEYTEINNAQKIYRYLENINANKVKIDTKLSLNQKNMKYIKENFNVDDIIIDLNKYYYDNDIFRDSLYNSLSHYIQEQKWEEAKNCILNHEQNEKELNNKKICFEKADYNNMKKLGFNNYWMYYNYDENKQNYLNKISDIFG